MFDLEFYPTPKSVLDMMDIDCYNKVVLEPSAGKGDIAKYCKNKGAKDIIACEKVPELRTILSKHATIINNDFFNVKSSDISHVDLIVMNPPFSTAVLHIMHAFDIAPEGCEIIALCNYQTIDNNYTRDRSRLQKIIADYGEAINIGYVFKTAERTTNVEIGLIKLFKPKYSDDNLEDFYYDISDDIDDNGVIHYNEIRAVVNTYVSAVKYFDEVEKIAEKLHSYTNTTLFDSHGNKHNLSFGDKISFRAGYNEHITTKEAFAKAFQTKCWYYIFERVNIQKYVTKGVMEDINKFINSRKNYPFTMKNISKMLDIIIGTRVNIMNKAIEEAVDNFTKHTHENRYGVEGWKTNSGYLLNKKFIVERFVRNEYFGNLLRVDSSFRNVEYMVDLTKAICLVAGKNFDDIEPIYKLEKLSSNVWYDWGFFEFKVFKKGTAHFKFKDLNDWALLNRAYAKIKGQVLPEKI